MINVIFMILLGVVLLLAGRRLFWLFVGSVGFGVGFVVATQLIHSQTTWIILVIALVLGLLSALLAVFLQQLAVGVAGFIAGGYGLSVLIEVFGWNLGLPSWIPFIIGGIVGAILMAVLFDWALILLSSLTGAILIVQAVNTDHLPGPLILAVLFFIGIAAQAASRSRSTSKTVVKSKS